MHQRSLRVMQISRRYVSGENLNGYRMECADCQQIARVTTQCHLKANVNMQTPFSEPLFIDKRFNAVGPGFISRHVEQCSYAARRSGTCARREVFLMRKTGFAQM